MSPKIIGISQFHRLMTTNPTRAANNTMSGTNMMNRRIAYSLMYTSLSLVDKRIVNDLEPPPQSRYRVVFAR